MDHVFCLDEKEGDLGALGSGKKTMIALGANERSACASIIEGDALLFSHDPKKGDILAKAAAAHVYASPPLSQESCAELLAANATALALTSKQVRELVNKKYLVLVELRDLELVTAEPVGRPSEAPAQMNLS